MRRAVFLVVAVVLAGCGGGGGARARPAELIGFDTYSYSAGGFDGTGTLLVRLDPVTFRREPGRGLRVGDWAASWLLGPDGRTLALGGTNSGEIVFVDLGRLVRTGAVRVARPTGGILGVQVGVIVWPRPDRLLALASQTPAKYLVPTRLVLVDPSRRRVLRSLPLRGAPLSWALAPGGRAVLLVSPVGRIGPARLVVADPSGRARGVVLKRILAGQGSTSRYYGIERWPGLAVRGDQAVVVGGREPIASVDLDTLAVAYHEVPGLMRAHLPLTPPTEAGTAGPLLAFSRTASWLEPDRLLVTGSDEYPLDDFRARWVDRAADIVDTRTWRLARVFAGLGSLQPADGLLFGSGAETVDKHSVGPSLVVLRPDGTLLYRKRQANLWWQLFAGRLIVGNPDGSWLAELDPATGRRIRRLGRASIWPLEEVIRWTPPGGGAVRKGR